MLNQSKAAARFMRHISVPFVRQYRVAIVGTGPAGFYTGHHLMHKANGVPIEIDFFDRLPTPYGLSRYGVAPDHPEVKNCEEYMDNLMKDYGNKVRFFGNVNIGSDISLKKLEQHYHLIILSYGCTSSDNQLSIPGADSPGVISARQFVNWYNSHPDSFGGSDKIPPPLERIEDVSIIGNGNVAIDVARILLADPKGHWAPTDISTEATELLAKSKVRRVNIVARRGLLESAFTNKEIRELKDVAKHLKVRFLPIEDSIIDPIRPKAKLLGRVDKRKFGILEKASDESRSLGVTEPGYKEWKLEYLKSPKEFLRHDSDPSLLKATVFDINEPHTDSLTKRVTVKPTGKTFTLKNELVILSIGYKGSSLKGYEEVGIAFNHKSNSLVHHDGRLLLASHVSKDIGDVDHKYNYAKGWYTSGWIKNGPKGVIATTMMDAFDTADKVLEDLTNGVHTEAKLEEPIEQTLGSDIMTWANWETLNAYELKKGEELEKSRNKVASAAEMLSIGRE